MLLPGNLTVIPAHTNFSGFSPTYLTVFLLGGPALPVLIYLAGRPRAGNLTAPTRDGGAPTASAGYAALRAPCPRRWR